MLEDRCVSIKAVVCVTPDTYWEMDSECVYVQVCAPTSIIHAALKVNIVESVSC